MNGLGVWIAFPFVLSFFPSSCLIKANLLAHRDDL
jgi:hypothetical protein